MGQNSCLCDPSLWASILVGTVLRLAIGQLAAPGGIWGDEPAHLRNGQLWAETGQYAHFWPPGYAVFLGWMGRLFGTNSWGVIRILQVVAAGWTSVCLYLIARDAWGRRAGRSASWGLALYLPLAALTQRFYSETLYLATLSTGWLALQRSMQAHASVRQPITAGVCLGALALFRDVGLLTWLAIAALLGVCAVWGRCTFGQFARSHLCVTAAAVLAWGGLVLLPASAANYDLRGVFRPSGGTALANLRAGLGTRGMNYELEILGDTVHGPSGSLRRALNDVPASLRQAPPIHGVTTAVQQIVREPTYFMRTRLVRWGDLMTPLNQAIVPWYLLVFDRSAAPSSVRRTMLVVSLLEVSALLLGGVLFGARNSRATPAIFAVATAVIAVTIATGILTAQSRFRAPMELVLILTCSGPIRTSARPLSSLGRAAVFGCLVLLGAAWIVAWYPLQAALGATW